MAVTSKPLNPRNPDPSLLIGRVGLALAILVFGGLVWAINGGFSVLGLEIIANSFNSAGRIFWAIISIWRFPIPQIPYLPTTQPLLPWIGVLSASITQIVVIYRKLKNLEIPRWMIISAIVLSLYDLATTFYGIGTMPWIQGAGNIMQGLIAFALTFTFELVLSFALKEITTWKREEK